MNNIDAIATAATTAALRAASMRAAEAVPRLDVSINAIALAAAACAAAASACAAAASAAATSAAATSASASAASARAAGFAGLRAVDAQDAAGDVAAWAEAIASAIDEAHRSPDAADALRTFLASPNVDAWNRDMMYRADYAIRAASQAVDWADAAAARAGVSG